MSVAKHGRTTAPSLGVAVVAVLLAGCASGSSPSVPTSTAAVTVRAYVPG